MSPSTLPRIPGPSELADVVSRVIGDWAFLPVQAAGRPAEGPAELGLEFSVHLMGPFHCLLVLRGDYDLAAELAEASTGDPSAREDAKDAFKELVNLLASHLSTVFFPHATFEPFLPLPSTPESWPDLVPSSASVMMVDRFPLELRLWILGLPHD
jgi:hypothetical protein